MMKKDIPEGFFPSFRRVVLGRMVRIHQGVSCGWWWCGTRIFLVMMMIRSFLPCRKIMGGGKRSIPTSSSGLYGLVQPKCMSNRGCQEVSTSLPTTLVVVGVKRRRRILLLVDAVRCGMLLGWWYLWIWVRQVVGCSRGGSYGRSHVGSRRRSV